MNDIHIKLDKLSFITDFIFITYYKKDYNVRTSKLAQILAKSLHLQMLY